MSESCALREFNQPPILDRLIAEDDRFYLIAAGVQISNGGHLLLIPKNHADCVAGMGWEEIKNLNEWKEKIGRALSYGFGIAPLFFEHGIVGQSVHHAHLHSVPLSFDPTLSVRGQFYSNRIEVIKDMPDLDFAYRKHARPYLYWQPHSRIHYVCWDPPAPVGYFCSLIANGNLRPGRAVKLSAMTDEQKAENEIYIAKTMEVLMPFLNPSKV